MQDPITQNDYHAFHSNGNIPSRKPTGPQGTERTTQDQPAEAPKDEAPVTEAPSPSQPAGPPIRRDALLPRRRVYYATIAGAIAGMLAALLTIIITLVNAGTFHAAGQQIAVDRLTVRTALALAAWELLAFTLSLLIGLCVGLIVGRIAVRRRLGFLAGAIAGAVFYLITFLVNLIPSYPGNLTVNGPTTTGSSLVISFLFLCLWSIGGGLVSLFGTWITTVRHPHYLRQET